MGLKIWLILMIIINTISCIGSVLTNNIIVAALTALNIVSAILILKKRKLGIYIFACTTFTTFAYNLAIGVSFVMATTGCFGLMITWLLAKNIWNEFV